MMGMMMKIMIVESDHGTVNGAKMEPITIKNITIIIMITILLKVTIPVTTGSTTITKNNR